MFYKRLFFAHSLSDVLWKEVSMEFPINAVFLVIKVEKGIDGF